MKPILWRFNGRPLNSNHLHHAQLIIDPDQSQVATSSELTSTTADQQIVVTNQSLVLRKVSRLQSGNYTCEATNLHGNNSSKPLELNIRHAPVCHTSTGAEQAEVLVYEAAPNQIVTIDCQVQANPSKSVHYSWFASHSNLDELEPASTLTRMLQADEDEQIDESSSRLKFKVRPSKGARPPEGASLALVKCKAKNEIGLQQRPCLFQVVQARPAQLRHSCHLVGVRRPNELQVNCKLNEHLKTNQLELMNNNSASTSSMMWPRLGLEAFTRSQQSKEQPSLSERPSLKLVYPPQWLLGELYKANNGQAASEPDEGNHYELASYVIISAAEQLNKIKTIVEENKAFRSNPRDVYYVIAKQTSNDTTTSATKPLDLPDLFNFTIPNLEPSSRYKLLIYGQNLANKTRDWLVVKGETSQDERIIDNDDDGSRHLATNQTRQTPVGQSLVSSSTNNLQADQQANLANRQATSQTGGHHQKPLVMRSQTDSKSSGLDDSSPDSPGHFINRLTAVNRSDDQFSGLVDRQMQHLVDYKDQAMSYAKQRPLVAIPMALGSCLMLLLVLIWLSGSFVALMRRLGGSRPGGGAGQRRRRASSNGRSSLIKDEEKSSQQHNGDSLNDRTTSNNSTDITSTTTMTTANGHHPKNHSPGDSSFVTQLSSTTDSLKNEYHQYHQQQPSVYTIEDNLNLLNVGQLQLEQNTGQDDNQFDLYTSKRANCPSHVHQVGSLNRRFSQHDQAGAIYLAELPGVTQLQQPQYYVNSIDRRLAHQHPYLIPAPDVAHHLHQMAQAGNNLMMEQGHLNGNYNSGSFGSTTTTTECSGTSGHHHPARRRQQHVAFDLSNTGKQQPAKSCLANLAVVDDSGHESPPQTSNEASSLAGGQIVQQLHTATCPVGQAAKRTALKHSHRAEHHQASQVSRPSDANLESAYQLMNDQRQSGLMLLEMSPGSQESSTILHSVDSFNELQLNHLSQQQHQQPVASILLHQNHQMATSFTSSSSSTSNNSASNNAAYKTRGHLGFRQEFGESPSPLTMDADELEAENQRDVDVKL